MNDSFELSSQTSGIRNRKLWTNHPATYAQQRLVFPRRGTRATQAEVLLDLLRRARAEGRALELPEIMAAGIAQHGARWHEIRARGFVVQNEILRDSSGRILSRYRLQFDPERDSEGESSK